MAIEKLKTKFASGAWINNVKQYFDKINEIIDYINGDNGLGTKRYVALLSQSGTDAPTAKVQLNTLGGTVTFSYDSTGAFFATLSSAFTADKTVIKTGALSGGDVFYGQWDDSSNIALYTESGGSPSDSLLSDNYIEIEVYP